MDSDGYSALKKLDLELRERHHNLIQIQDRVATLRKSKEDLVNEIAELNTEVKSLKLQEEAATARRDAVHARLETINKEIDVEILPTYKKLKQKVEERQQKHDYILEYQNQKLRDMEQVVADNLGRYKQLPSIVEYEQERKKLDDLEILAKEKASELAVLKEEFYKRKDLEKEKWTKFKAICIKAAQDWKDKIAKEKQKERRSVASRRMAKFGDMSLMTLSRNTRTLPSSSSSKLGAQKSTLSLPNPWDTKNSIGAIGSVKFDDFGEAWKNLTTRQRERNMKNEEELTMIRNKIRESAGRKIPRPPPSPTLPTKPENFSRRPMSSTQETKDKEPTSSSLSESKLSSSRDRFDLDVEMMPRSTREKSPESVSSSGTGPFDPSDDLFAMDQQDDDQGQVSNEKSQELTPASPTPPLQNPTYNRSSEGNKNLTKEKAAPKSDFNEIRKLPSNLTLDQNNEDSFYRPLSPAPKMNKEPSNSEEGSQSARPPGQPNFDEGVFRRPFTPPPKKNIPFSFAQDSQSDSEPSSSQNSFLSRPFMMNMEVGEDDDSETNVPFSFMPMSPMHSEDSQEDAPFTFNFDFNNKDDEHNGFDFLKDSQVDRPFFKQHDKI